ncbi:MULTISPECIES: preprotein translocase subunit SecA [unclassified Acinetobacter]|uniref:preprotein translocase subunit SecA n=1 Tax=unclassified Acinetobacter TaxID=196816 RepID=UPI0035B6FC5D
MSKANPNPVNNSSNNKALKTSFKTATHGTWQWKLFLGYDILMMFLITINVLVLFLQAIIMSDFGAWFSQHSPFGSSLLIQWRQYYIDTLAPLVQLIDFYFICFLISELFVRWGVAIIGKQHRHWWFFPFVHWYEVLAILPSLRFLRLLRAGVIAYRFHEMGYHVVPKSWILKAQYYYAIVLEEVTDRIVLTALHQLEKEFENNDQHHDLLHKIIDDHRQQFADVLSETLHQTLAKELAVREQMISKNVGQIVQKAIEDAPELHQMLRLIPMVGSRLEQQIHLIGQRLGENITQGLIEPFIQSPRDTNQQPPSILQDISHEISQVPLDSDQIDALVSSVMQQSIHGIREQVKVKHWHNIKQYDKASIQETLRNTGH